MPGLASVRVDGDTCELHFHDPLRTWARVHLRRSERRLELILEQGEVLQLGGELALRDGVLELDLVVRPLYRLPGPLERELEERWPLRALQALAAE